MMRTTAVRARTDTAPEPPVPGPSGRSRPRSGPSAAPEGPAGRRPRAPGRRGLDPGPTDARRNDARTPSTRPGPATAATPAALARGFAHLYLEVECGRRSARQLAGLMDTVLHARLESLWIRPDQPLGRIQRVHARQTAPGRIDAVVVVRRGDRSGALALELARKGGRWVVTTAVRPEDGPLPPAPFSVPWSDDEHEGLGEIGGLPPVGEVRGHLACA